VALAFLSPLQLARLNLNRFARQTSLFDQQANTPTVQSPVFVIQIEKQMTIGPGADALAGDL
jgi:hypothetical protein